MKKSTIPQNLKTLKKWFDASTLDLSHPIQRSAGQWNNLQQSLLVHSILSDFIIPPLYLTKEKQGKNTIYHLLEGKQRITSLFDFISDEYSLHPKTPVVILDGKTYDIALRKFSELETELREEILGFFFTIYQIEDATDDEIEESFARLNSGTALSKIQQARPKLGTELADWANKLVATDFFQKSLNLTVSQLRHEDDFLMLITGMMLLDNRSSKGFQIKTSASAAECVRFAESIKNNYSQEKREDIELLVDYLSVAFNGAEYKFLKKNNIPIVMVVGQIAIEHGISEAEFLNTVVEFFENDCSKSYNEASGSGNVKLVNINTRLQELTGYLISALPSYFEDENEIPADFIRKAESSETDSPIPENDLQDDQLTQDDTQAESENSENTFGDSSLDAESDFDSEISDEQGSDRLLDIEEYAEEGDEGYDTDVESDESFNIEADSDEPSNTGEE